MLIERTLLLLVLEYLCTTLIEGIIEQTITCSSQGFAYTTCALNGDYDNIEITQQLSGSPCTLDVSYGLITNSIWVDNGCRATFKVTAGGSCGTSSTVGESNPKAKDNTVDGGTGTSTLILNNDYKVDCDCGSVEEWEYYAKDNTGDIHFQMWRQVGSTNDYTLIGENIVTITGATVDNERTETIAVADRIQVLKDDYIGVYSPGLPIVSNKHEGSGKDYIETNTVGTIAVGNTFSWESIATADDRKYAVNAKVTQGSNPTFNNLDTSITITDASTISDLVYTLTVSDPDGDPLTTTMTSSVSPYFDFSTTTLQITVKTNGVPATTYPLDFTTTDYCSNTDTGTLTIIVTNSSPHITNQPAYATINEDTTAETLLISISTTDLSPSDTITCSLTSSKFNTKLTALSVYGIYSNLNPSFAYGTTKKYTLSVTCTDSFTVSDTGKFYVYILPNTAPTFTNMPNSISVSESTGSGVSVFQVATSDAEGNSITHSATCSAASCPFTLTGAGELQTNVALSGLTTAGYEIYVSISDTRSTVGPRTLSIAITGINSAPVIQNLPLTFSLSVLENVGVGTTVFQVKMADVDSLTQTITYSASFSPVEGGTIVTIGPTTGLISTSAAIDYEALTAKSFTVLVSVTDGLVSDSQSLQFNVIDLNEAPTFSSTINAYYLTGTEGDTGLSFGDPGFVTSDPDPGDVITYSMDCTDFNMVSSTGIVSLATPYDLDTAGTATSLTCNVQASDGELVDTSLLFITINELNDNNPTFSETAYTFSTNMYASVGDVIGTITATDGDIGIYGSMIYTLDQSSLADTYFGVTGTGGIYVAKSTFTALGDGVFMNFTAVVTDFGGINDTAKVYVVILETTTAASTTTTERYQIFIEDPRNVAWLTIMSLFSFGSICVVGYLIQKHDILKNCYRGLKSTFQTSKPKPRPRQKQRKLRMRDIRKKQRPIQNSRRVH